MLQEVRMKYSTMGSAFDILQSRVAHLHGVNWVYRGPSLGTPKFGYHGAGMGKLPSLSKAA